jgi:hypothetical protein
LSSQASVHSVEALKDLRAAFALFAEDAQAALGAVEMEIRRTVQWLQHDRKLYWQDQIKRRRELVAQAQAEVFRRKLAQTSDLRPAFSEQKEILRKAEASLRDAEQRVIAVKKWETALQLAILEYHASSRRITDLARGDVPRASALLESLVDKLEAYLRVAPPTGRPITAALASIAENIIAEDAAAPATSPEPPPATEQEERKMEEDSLTIDEQSDTS